MEIWEWLSRLDILFGLVGAVFAFASNRKAKKIEELLTSTVDLALLEQEKNEIIGKLVAFQQSLNSVDTTFSNNDHKKLQNLIIDTYGEYSSFFDRDENFKKLKAEIGKPDFNQPLARELIAKIIKNIKRGGISNVSK